MRERKQFKTHTVSFSEEEGFIIVSFLINDNIYLEMELSSRAAEFGDSIKNQNNRMMMDLFSMMGVTPNLDYLFLPNPIENERYLIYRFIKSIVQQPYPNLYQFENDEAYRQFCSSYGLTYEYQTWFKRLYIKDTYDNAVRYIMQQSLVFQELYFPEGTIARNFPTLHDVQAANLKYHFKDDFMEFYRFLSEKSIDKLYHFTDSSNVESIINSGYIYSNRELIRKGMKPQYASSLDSREADKRSGLDDFVRVSFVKNHPMMHVAMTCGRIRKPVILEINPFTLLLPDTLISDRNALKTGAQIGSSSRYLFNVRTELFSSNYFTLSPDERSFFQAEVLIPKRIGVEMITNINNI